MYPENSFDPYKDILRSIDGIICMRVVTRILRQMEFHGKGTGDSKVS